MELFMMNINIYQLIKDIIEHGEMIKGRNGKALTVLWMLQCILI